jgi:flagellar basal-body rod protein FlgG
MNGIYGTPLTGIQSANFALDVVANNIANLNTAGYQAVEAQLGSLPAEDPIGDTVGPVPPPAGSRVGMGAQPAATVRSEQQAVLQPTGRPLDLAVDGPGYIALRDAGGRVVYAQQASLHLGAGGQLATDQGLSLSPTVTVPAGVSDISVDGQGTIVGRTAAGAVRPLGRVQVVTFSAPENLAAQGGGLYAESLSSGRPLTPTAGQTEVLSGYTLASTVDLAQEMTTLIETEHMYQASTKALQTMDTLVSTAVSLSSR